MADNEQIDAQGTAVRGTEWEVVSLTASAYAAAPGPQAFEKNIEDESNVSEGHEGESSHELFLSRHFAFPVNESLSSEADKSQMQNTDKDKDLFCELVKEGYKADKHSISAPELEANKNLLDSNIKDNEEKESLYLVAPDSSFHTDAQFDEKVDSPSFPKLSEPDLDVDGNVSEMYEKEHQSPGESSLASEAWWKRQAAFLYAHAKETNALWSIFVAAAVMGLVCLGHHWQKERRQILQVKWHVSLKEEKPGRVIQPVSLLKSVILGSGREGAHCEL